MKAISSCLVCRFQSALLTEWRLLGDDEDE